MRGGLLERDEATNPESASDPGSRSEKGPPPVVAEPCLWEHRLEHVQTGERRRWISFDDKATVSGWSGFRRLPLGPGAGVRAAHLQAVNTPDPLLGFGASPCRPDDSASLREWIAVTSRPSAEKLRTVERLIASWSYLLSAAPHAIESCLQLGSIRVDPASGQPFVDSVLETTAAAPRSSAEETGRRRAAALIRWALLGGGDEPGASMAELRREAVAPARSELGPTKVRALLRLAKRADQAELKLRELSADFEELLYSTALERVLTLSIGRLHRNLKSLRKEYGVKQVRRLRLQWIGKALIFSLGSMALPTLLQLIESYSWALVIAVPFSSLLTLTFIVSAAILMWRAGSESEGVVIDRGIQTAHHLRVASYRLGLVLLIFDLGMATKVDWSDWGNVVNRVTPSFKVLGPEDLVSSKLGAALRGMEPPPPDGEPKDAEPPAREVQPSGMWEASDGSKFALCETEILWEKHRVCGRYSAEGTEPLFLLGCTFDQDAAGWTIKAHYIESEAVREEHGAAESSEEPIDFRVKTSATGRALEYDDTEFLLTPETCVAWGKRGDDD